MASQIVTSEASLGRGLAANDAAIQVSGLRRSFEGGIDAVAGIDLTVAKGEIFGFLGPNGAGKTTTVRMLCTLLAPSAGSARVAGHDVVSNPAQVRACIGVALQEIGLDPLQTGRELLELQCGLYGLGLGHARSRTAELLQLVGLDDAADRRSATYSGGMKRRLDLASALVHAPKVLFLDEPTTGLDPVSRRTIWEEVQRVNAQGATVFLTTQYLEEADRLCGRVAIIDEGCIVACGRPDALKAAVGRDVVSIALPDGEPQRAEQAIGQLEGLERAIVEPHALVVYVDDGARRLAEIVRHLDSDQIPYAGLTVSRPSLDDVFLQATGRHLKSMPEQAS